MANTLFLVLITTALINNVVLSQFLGICPFLGVSKNVKTAAGMGGAVIFVITLASAVCNLLYTNVLVRFNLTYLNTIVFIIVIAFLVQLVEVFLKKVSPSLYRALGVYLPLITTNCAVLGTALTNVKQSNGFVASVVTGFGTALGFCIAIVIMAGVREKTEKNDFPKSFKGTPAVLLTACFMSMAFYGFSAFAGLGA
jgi:electron transport complex protein RnfA